MLKKHNKLEDKVYTVRPGFRKTVQELHFLQNYVEARQWLKEQSKKLAFSQGKSGKKYSPDRTALDYHSLLAQISLLLKRSSK